MYIKGILGNIVNTDDIIHMYAIYEKEKWRLICNMSSIYGYSNHLVQVYLTDYFDDAIEVQIRIDKIWEDLKSGVQFHEME